MGDGAHTHARQAIRRDESWVESTLAGRFYDQVRSTPDRIAIADAGSSVSYAALGARVAGLSELFRAEGVRPGDVAAVLADTGSDAVAALLGILACGAAFAPLDVLDPPARAAALLELAGSTCLVTSGDRRGQALEIAEAAPLRVRVVDISSASPAELGRPAAVTPTSPASVFFTSGSTGSPKAVLDLQRNVLHNVLRYTNLLAITADDRLSAVQRLGFSGIASSIFTALLNGATLCTFRLDAATLPALAAWVRREQVTVFHAVPAIFRVLVASGFGFPDVRVVRLEGDRASWRDVELFRSRFSPTAILANGLGTTETGLVCQYRVGREATLEDGVLPVAGHRRPRAGRAREPPARGEHRRDRGQESVSGSRLQGRSGAHGRALPPGWGRRRADLSNGGRRARWAWRTSRIPGPRRRVAPYRGCSCRTGRGRGRSAQRAGGRRRRRSPRHAAWRRGSARRSPPSSSTHPS